jgi:ribonuclease P protein component
MLPKRGRLTSKEVDTVLSRGKSLRAGVLSAKILLTTTPFKAAVVVSKRLSRNAVRRNQLRRAAYAALRRASLPPTGHAILFVQSIPDHGLVAAFENELKKLFHV